MMESLLEKERGGWEALSTSKSAAQRFYDPILADEALMIFPGDMLLSGKKTILDSIGSQPWESFEMEDTRMVALTTESQAVIYRVTAQRAGSEPYRALISSVYVHQDGRWQLILHQQTPV
jgi:hypothetical protein